MENQSIPYYDILPDFLKAVKSIDFTNRCFGLFPFKQFGGPGEVIPPFRSNTYTELMPSSVDAHHFSSLLCGLSA